MKQSIRSKEEKRSYRSPMRQRQAEETRRRILEAARDLLGRLGYAGTTVEAIAELAGVSPKTVSAVIGSKRELLAEIVQPDAYEEPVQQLLTQLRTSEEPVRRVELVVTISRHIYESLTLEFELLRTAGAVAPELAELARHIETRRRERQSYLVTALHERDALRRGLTPEEALDTLWSLTSYDMYRLLVVERGWSATRYESWLSALLIAELLQPGINSHH
ncbi:TetR/AcrR family transcriptional regulator [Dictyobacter aurantiacus]|uniref:TetR family transcriptional regulator n=1 Tax=Dictyobacter aurantiacus TaxID=1936993 RepID=A0A401ZK85_9CHLR|nr:TetR/AcrR family transcriptional regulator [Dictyobacter aurantiacus]GCE07240.1 TetR family transcriptional regulator [Dictyobacter aurantiacus]